MLRVSKNPLTLIDELKSGGMLKKDIAKKLGIARRTLSSYYNYFSGSRPTENDRKNKPEIVKKLRKLAQKNGLRTTVGILNDDELIYIKTFYEVKKDNQEIERRNLMIPKSLMVWRSENDKEGSMKDFIEKRNLKVKSSDILSVKIISIITVMKSEI